MDYNGVVQSMTFCGLWRKMLQFFFALHINLFPAISDRICFAFKKVVVYIKAAQIY